MLRDEDGGLMHAGRYWDPESRKHTSGDGPGGRAYSAVPYDVDGDGDLDLLVGTDRGEVHLRRNVGTRAEPSFATKLEPLNGAVFQAGYAMPVPVDWDGDGLFDLVSGGKSGGVHWVRNIGEKGAPLFARAEALVTPAATTRAGLGERTQIDVADFDADGDLDLLVGDYESWTDGGERMRRANVWLFRRTGTPGATAVEASSRGASGSGR